MIPRGSFGRDSRNTAHDWRPDQSREKNRKSLPEADEQGKPRIVPPGILRAAGANVVLPARVHGLAAPLFLEPVRGAVAAGPAEIEHLLAALHGTLKQMPVEQHVGAGGVVA